MIFFLPSPPLTVYLYSSDGSEQKMEILYILKPPALIIFILARRHETQDGLRDFFFSFFTHSAALTSNYTNAIMTSCWFFHYHIKVKKKKNPFRSSFEVAVCKRTKASQWLLPDIKQSPVKVGDAVKSRFKCGLFFFFSFRLVFPQMGLMMIDADM